MPSPHCDRLIVGASCRIGVDSVPQIKRASVNQNSGKRFTSRAMCIYFVIATVLLFGCLKLPVTKYYAWSLTANHPYIEFYQRSPSTAEIFWRVCVTSTLVVAAFSSILILKRLFRRKQPIDSYCTATDEATSTKSASARYRFKKRMILVCVLICLFFGWLAWRFAAAHGQQQIVAEVLQLGGSIAYDFKANSGPFQQNGPPPEPAWIVKFLGVDFFHNVVQVDFYPGQPVPKSGSLPQLRQLTRLRLLELCGEFHDEDVGGLVGLKELESVWLGSQGITDASVESIAKLSSLKSIRMSGSGVTADGKRRLQQLLPNLFIQ